MKYRISVVGLLDSTQSVLNVDVLEAGKMDKCKDLKAFDKIQIDDWVRALQNGRSCGVFPVCSG